MRSCLPGPARALRLLGPLAALAVALVVFGALNRDRASRADAPAGRIPFVSPQADTDEQIAALQARVRAGVRPAPYADLGAAYLQKVRESGDAAFYPKAEQAFEEARRRDPADLTAITGQGTLALARHDFRQALALARRARAVAPEAVGPFPVLVDALVELGRYEEAARALQELVDRKPGLPAYARISYFRELHGDQRGALAAMELAVSAAAGTSESLAYVRSLQGTLRFNQGQLRQAATAYRAALRAQPDFAPAQAGLARVDGARGRLKRAIGRLRRVVDRLPLPEHVIALGEAELAAGDTAQAHEDLELVRAERRLLAVNGVNTDVELALFEADHGDPREAIALGRRAWAAAPGVRSADALGWALTRAGRPAEGYAWGRRALGRGWREPLALYHAGMSARAAGRQVAARRILGRLVAQAPRFSPLYGPRARRSLEGLR